jgi:hypothetical protein
MMNDKRRHSPVVEMQERGWLGLSGGGGLAKEPGLRVGLTFDRRVDEEAGNKADDPGDSVVRPLPQTFRPQKQIYGL